MADERLRQVLAQTVSDEQFTAAATRAGLARTVADGPPADTGEARPPSLDQPGLAGRVTGLPVAADPARYELLRPLGSGASATVYAARDRTCDRVIAVKVLHPSHASDAKRTALFVHEARVVARLDHPGILPVYDLDVAASGEPFFTMRNIDGLTLGDGMRQVREGKPPRALKTLVDRVGVLVRVAEAVAFAHHRGVVHQDIKPDNILVGEFGEVVLLDWGTAIESGGTPPGAGEAPKVVGTPLYMSPEQARGEIATAASDQYCLGATLWELLTFKPPTWDDVPERFWDKKRAGMLDAPDAMALAELPPALVAVAHKALAAKPADRYPDVEALITDLKSWQQGQAVSARRDPVLVRLRRWHRRNGTRLWLTLGVLAVVATLGGWLWREKAREAAQWRLFVREDFSNADPQRFERFWDAVQLDEMRFRKPAQAADTQWGVADGKLVARKWGGLACDLAYARSVPGDMRVIWTMTPRDGNSNLNCFLAGGDRMSGYTFHLGGWRIPTYAVLSRGANVTILDSGFRSEPFIPGRSYRLMMERDGDTISFAIDGRTVLSYRDPEALAGPGHQQFGFEAVDTSFVIDDLEVWFKPLPLRASPLAVADWFVGEGLYDQALARYDELLTAYPDSPEVAPAHLRRARCLGRLGRTDEALTTLRMVISRYPEEARQAEIELLGQLLAQGGMEAAKQQIARLAARTDLQPGDRRRLVREIGNTLVKEAGLDDDACLLLPDLRERIAGVRKQIMLATQQFRVSTINDDALRRCADRLLQIGDPDLVMNNFPGQRWESANALLALGQFDRLIAEYPEMTDLTGRALLMLGRDTEVTERWRGQWLGRVALLRQGRSDLLMADEDPEGSTMALLAGGKPEEVLARFPDRIGDCAEALMHLGRADEVLKRYGHVEGLRLRALLLTGNIDSLIQEAQSNRPEIHEARALHALRRHLAGDRAGAQAELDALVALPLDHRWERAFVARYVLPSLLRAFSGDRAGAEAAWTAMAQVPAWRGPVINRLRLEALTGTGTTEAVATAPHLDPDNDAQRIEARFYAALRADLTGDKPAAIAAYKVWRAEPLWRRRYDVVADAIAAWRLAELSK